MPEKSSGFLEENQRREAPPGSIQGGKHIGSVSEGTDLDVRLVWVPCRRIQKRRKKLKQ